MRHGLTNRAWTHMRCASWVVFVFRPSCQVAQSRVALNHPIRRSHTVPEVARRSSGGSRAVRSQEARRGRCLHPQGPSPARHRVATPEIRPSEQPGIDRATTLSAKRHLTGLASRPIRIDKPIPPRLARMDRPQAAGGATPADPAPIRPRSPRNGSSTCCQCLSNPLADRTLTAGTSRSRSNAKRGRSAYAVAQDPPMAPAALSQ